MGLIDILHQKVSVDNEAVAKGFALAWTAIVASDCKIDKAELLLLNNFAKNSVGTKKFYSEQWIAGVFEEAIKLLNEGGQNAVYSEIVNLFENAAEGDRQVLLYSLMNLACIDGDFSRKEMDSVFEIAETLGIEAKDILYTGMLFAAKSFKK